MVFVSHIPPLEGQDDIPKWGFEGKYLHGTTKRFCCGRKRTYGMPPEEIHLRITISIKTVVFKV